MVGINYIFLPHTNAISFVKTVTIRETLEIKDKIIREKHEILQTIWNVRNVFCVSIIQRPQITWAYNLYKRSTHTLKTPTGILQGKSDDQHCFLKQSLLTVNSQSRSKSCLRKSSNKQGPVRTQK